MRLKLYVICLLMTLMLFISVDLVSASVQTFESDIGNIKIDLPYTVEPGDSSSGNSLQLVKPGTTKPIISININDAEPALYKDFKDFAESFIGPGYTFEEMTSNDGKPMLFNFFQEGTDRDGNPKYTFRGYIDYSKDKGKYIIIHAPNDVIYQGETIATYTKDQFAEICRSFTA
jgi:hypothetical protein